MSEPVSPADTIRRDDEWWLIFFEDADRSDEVFTDEAAARERFKRLSVQWNCTLFASESALLAVGERDRRQIAQLTEALTKATWHLANYTFRGKDTSLGEEAARLFDEYLSAAVLADEEAAG